MKMTRPSFQEILDELDVMQKKKGADYGTDEDPLANLVASEDMNIPPWINTFLRMYDKVSRIKTFIRKGKLENEDVDESLKDLAVYSIHALRLYREAKEESILAKGGTGVYTNTDIDIPGLKKAQ